MGPPPAASGCCTCRSYLFQCFAILVACCLGVMNIVFPGENNQRLFCHDRRIQALPVNASQESDTYQYRGAFYLTDEEAAYYYWVVVFISSAIVFFASVVYLLAGIELSIILLAFGGPSILSNPCNPSFGLRLKDNKEKNADSKGLARHIHRRQQRKKSKLSCKFSCYKVPAVQMVLMDDNA